MKLSDQELGALVDRVVQRLTQELQGGGGGGSGGSVAGLGGAGASRGAGGGRALGGLPPVGGVAGMPHVGAGDPGLFESVDDAVAAAEKAHQALREHRLEERYKFVEAMRRVTLEHVDTLSRMAVAETGLGRVADKLQKNRCAAMKTPGPEILKPEAFSGDEGLSIVEYAPFGVIASVTPCTNATETIANNAISFVSGGNTAVFNVHPSAKGVCCFHVRLLNQAILEAGGPPNVVCAIVNPTVESAQKVMRHPGTRLVVVTGGGAVVKEAMSSGKRAVAAGPGNPPVVVDETADIKRAAKGVVDGCSIDNNIVCIAEKELIAVADIADMLKREILGYSAIEVKGRDLAKLEKLLITDDNHVNRKYVGKNASVIAADIGIRIGDDVRVILAEVDEKHPFVQHEMLLPVLGMVRVPNVDAGIEMARRVEHGFRHTAVMYSTNIGALHRMAVRCDASIYVKNAPSFAGIGMGGEGYTAWTIAGPTGEGLTNARTFTRVRRCTLKEYFRFV
jgi:aldehyde dehydrogenase